MCMSFMSNRPLPLTKHRLVRGNIYSWYRFSAREHFCKCWSAGPTPQSPTWRTRVYLFVWPLTLILSGKGDPTSSYATVGIALGILEVHKPSHLVQSTFVKVEILSIGHVERWTQRDYQKLWFTGNLKEGKNEAVPGEPGKMEYIQPWMEEI